MPLSKKDREGLHSIKCLVTKPTALPLNYIVQMSLTKGELLAMKNALEAWPTPVGEDVLAFLNNGLTREGIDL